MTEPSDLITAHVRGHIREAVKYALINSPDVPWTELAMALSVEATKFSRELCRERDAREKAL